MTTRKNNRKSNKFRTNRKTRSKRQRGGNTYLIESAQGGDIDGVNTALEKGAHVNYQTYLLKNTALIQASRNGFVNVVEKLLEAGADVNRKNHEGNTALIFASMRGHPAIVRKLLDADAEVNVKNKKDGWTALMFASMRGHPAIVRMLLENGADVNAMSKGDWTAFKIAHRRRDQKLMNLLTQYITIPIMSKEEFATCDTGPEQVPVDSISLNELNRNRAVKPMDSNYCFDRSTLQRWLKQKIINPETGEENTRYTNPSTRIEINEEWINKWYPLGLDENYGDMDITGGKRKTKKNEKVQKKNQKINYYIIFK